MGQSSSSLQTRDEVPRALQPREKKQKFEAKIKVDDSSPSNLLSVVEDVVDVCNDFGRASGVLSLDKKSQSSSSQVLSNLNGKKVFMKIFNDQSLKTEGNGLLVEAAIYFCAIAKLIPNHCPFFVQPLAYQECDGFLNRLAKKTEDPLDTSDRKQIESILSSFEKPNMISKEDLPKYRQALHPPNERSYIIINEQLNVGSVDLPRDVTMYQWSQTIHTLDAYKAVFFQVFWTLLSMEIIGLKHNDLHTLNIFIRRLPKPVKYTFILPYQGKFNVINLETEYMILVYDFDRSTILGVTDNSVLKFLCNDGHGCQNGNFGYDLTRMVCYLEQQLKVQKVNSPPFSSDNLTVSQVLKFLEQFDVVQGRNLSKLRDGSCSFFSKSTLLQKDPSLKDSKFVGSEIQYDFDYGKILSEDPFFDSIRKDEKTLSEMIGTKTFILPTEKVKSEIESCIRKSFPSIVYKPPSSQIMV